MAVREACFNPCFNGTMYKNKSILTGQSIEQVRFNPCFNGSMYKNTVHCRNQDIPYHLFQSLF